MSRLGLLLVLATLFGGLAYFWMGSSPSKASRVPVLQDAPEVTTPPASGELKTQPQGRGVTLQRKVQSSRNTLSSESFRFFQTSSARRIQITHGVTKEPVGGIGLWAVRAREHKLSWCSSDGFFGRDYPEFLRRHATSSISTADGFAVASDLANRIWARGPGLAGNYAPPKRGMLRSAGYLSVFPVQQPTVLVLDDQGRPVEDVRIAIRKNRHGLSHLVVGCTDASGQAVLQLDLEARELLKQTDYYLGVEAHGFEPIPLEPNAESGSIHELQATLPFAKKLQVQFLHPDGGACQETLVTHLYSGEAENETVSEAGCTQGMITFPAIAPGTKLRLAVSSWDLLMGASETIFVPTTEAETESVTVQLRWDRFALRGRLLLPDGTPAANQIAHLDVGVVAKGKMEAYPFLFTTNSNGEFVTESTDPLHEKGSLVWEGLQIRLRRAEGEPLLCFLPQASASKLGMHDLGDIVMQNPVLLAEGTLVDQYGLPDTTSRLELHTGDFRGNYSYATTGSRIWAQDGVFQIHGPPQPENSGTYTLVASGPGVEETRLKVRVPQKNISMVVRKKVNLSGTIELDPPLSAQGFRILIKRENNKPVDQDTKVSRPALNGSYFIEDMKEGVYLVSLQLPSGETVQTLGPISLGFAHDPTELPPFNLLGILSGHTLSVFQSNGKTLHNAWYRIGYEGKETRIPGGEITAILYRSQTEITVGAPGFRSALLRNPASEERVVLQSGIRIHLQGPGHLDLAPGWRLAARMTQVIHGQPSKSHSTAPWQTVGGIEGTDFQLPQSGTYQLELSLRGVSSSKKILLAIPLPLQNAVVSVGQSSNQRLDFPLTPNAIQIVFSEHQL
ncbi:MAG: hypothetical protein QM477_02625 [Planctomycetota bacterium]